MAKEQTSARVSGIAARWLKIDLKELRARLETEPISVIKDIRAMAASCLTQDETPQRTPDN